MTNRAKTTAASTAGSFAPDAKAEPGAVLGTEPVCEVDEHGTKLWTVNGELHRTDGPAIEFADGARVYLQEGLFHRTDGPAYEDGDVQFFYIDGALHRTDGPAYVHYDGSRGWFQYGELHREDGPALELADGSGFWYLYGLSYRTEQEWRAALNTFAAHL